MTCAKTIYIAYRQMVYGPRWAEVAKLLPHYTEAEVRIRTYSPTFAEKWKAFSSTVVPDASLQVVRGVYAWLARAAAMSTTAVPMNSNVATSAYSPKKVGADEGYPV